MKAALHSWQVIKLSKVFFSSESETVHVVSEGSFSEHFIGLSNICSVTSDPLVSRTGYVLVVAYVINFRSKSLQSGR